MKPIYDFFQYRLPEGAADEYAQRAVKILQEIQAKFPELYTSFKAPSEILTLSGVRAFDTYYDLGEEAIQKQITGIKALLKKHGILLLEADFLPANDVYSDHQYSLVHMEALRDLPNRYGHIPGWRSLHIEAMKQDFDFMTWWHLFWQKGIAAEERDNETIRKWLRNDWWAPHNISFGMLLGYPGEAIVSYLEESEDSEVATARILHADIPDTAQPMYSYLSSLANNVNIVAHEKLWSEILGKVYNMLLKENI